MTAPQTAAYKFGMLSGALKNAGDFLIVQRSEELLKSVYPNAEFHVYNRCKNLDGYLYELNKMDALILCGGPLYISRLYPDGFPVSDLDRLQAPLFALGMGWFGRDGTAKTVYRYRLEDTTIRLLKRIEQDTGTLGCRDWYSVNVLRNNGVWSGKMTGCPAWYHPEFLTQQDFSNGSPGQIHKICISDPANTDSLEQMVALAAYLRQLFPKAEIKAVFHRGLKADTYTEKNVAHLTAQAAAACEKLGLECLDISYGYTGFSVYDHCDLQIGYRVHAHIYNLSRRNLSILIEEDGRGAGVNHALGLERITAYDFGLRTSTGEDRVSATIEKTENTGLLQWVDDYLNNLYQTDFLQIRNAFRLMQGYYKQMEQHLAGLSAYI